MRTLDAENEARNPENELDYRKTLMRQGQHFRKVAFERSVSAALKDENPLQWAQTRRIQYGITDPVGRVRKPVQTGKVLKHDEPAPEPTTNQPVAAPPKANAPTDQELQIKDQIIEQMMGGKGGKKLTTAQRAQARIDIDPVYKLYLEQAATLEPSPNAPLFAVETPKSIGGITVDEAKALDGQTKALTEQGLDVESAQKIAKSEAMLKQKQEEVQQLQQQKQQITQQVEQAQKTSPKRKGASVDVEKVQAEAAQKIAQIDKKLQEPNIVVHNPDELKSYQPTREMREAEQIFMDAVDSIAEPDILDARLEAIRKDIQGSRFGGLPTGKQWGVTEGETGMIQKHAIGSAPSIKDQLSDLYPELRNIPGTPAELVKAITNKKGKLYDIAKNASRQELDARAAEVDAHEARLAAADAAADEPGTQPRMLDVPPTLSPEPLRSGATQVPHEELLTGMRPVVEEPNLPGLVKDLAKTALDSRYRVELVDAKQPTQAVRVHDYSNGTFADFSTVKDAHKYLRDNGVMDVEGLEAILRMERGQEKTLSEQLWGEKPAEEFGAGTVGAAEGGRGLRMRRTRTQEPNLPGTSRQDPLVTARVRETEFVGDVQERNRLLREEVLGPVVEGPRKPVELNFFHTLLDLRPFLKGTGVPEIYDQAIVAFKSGVWGSVEKAAVELNKLKLTIPWQKRRLADAMFHSQEFKEAADILNGQPIEKLPARLQPLGRAIREGFEELRVKRQIPFDRIVTNYFPLQAEMPNFSRVEKALDNRLRFEDLSPRDQQAFQHAHRIAEEQKIGLPEALYTYEQTHFGRGRARTADLSPHLRARTGAVSKENRYDAYREMIYQANKELHLEPALEKTFLLMQDHPESTRMIVGRVWDKVMGIPTEKQVIARNTVKRLLMSASGGRYQASGLELERAAHFLEKMSAMRNIGLNPVSAIKHGIADNLNVIDRIGVRWWMEGLKDGKFPKMQRFADEKLGTQSQWEAAYETVPEDVKALARQHTGSTIGDKLLFGVYTHVNQANLRTAALGAYKMALKKGAEIPEVAHWMKTQGVSKEVAAQMYGKLIWQEAISPLTPFDVPLVSQEPMMGLPFTRLLTQFTTRRAQSVNKQVQAFSAAVRGQNYGRLARVIIGTGLLTGFPFDEDLKIAPAARKGAKMLGDLFGPSLQAVSGIEIHRIPFYNLGHELEPLSNISEHVRGWGMIPFLGKTPRSIADLKNPDTYRTPGANIPAFGNMTQAWRAARTASDWKTMILGAYEGVGPAGGELQKALTTAQEMKTGQEREGVRGKLLGPISPLDAFAKHALGGSRAREDAHELKTIAQQHREAIQEKLNSIGKLASDLRAGYIDEDTYNTKRYAIMADGTPNPGAASLKRLAQDVNIPAVTREYMRLPKHGPARAEFIKKRNELNGVYAD